jgi:hypothetical protein
MAIVSLDELKSYFQTGDHPTQEQFSNLIDTFGNVLEVVNNIGSKLFHDTSVNYPANSAVLRTDGIYYNINPVSAGAFDGEQWTLLFSFITEGPIRSITVQALLDLKADNLLNQNIWYFVNNAVENTMDLLVTASEVGVLSPMAIDVATGQTGTYSLEDDLFAPLEPETGIVTFKKTITAANVIAGGFFAIPELPAPGEGNAWKVTEASIRVVNPVTPFDGAPVLGIGVGEFNELQWLVSNECTGDNNPYFGDLIHFATQQDRQGISIAEDAAMGIFIQSGGCTEGDATFIFYGSARKIQL